MARQADPTTPGGYLMYAEGIDKTGKHSIGLYVSPDGLQWQRTSDKPVLAGSDDDSEWGSIAHSPLTLPPIPFP